jgi:hypothetical protein
MGMLTVKAKGNLGIHPVYGEIVEGREYEIDENDFGEELFVRVPVEAAAQSDNQQPAASGRVKGGK